MITLNKDRAFMCKDDPVYIGMDGGSYSYTLRYSIGGKTGTIRENWEVEHLYWWVPDLAGCIPGKTEGICTITCIYKRAGAVVKTETASLTLVVPEASQVEANAGAAVVKMGNYTSFSTNRKSSGFTHTLTFCMGEYTGTIATGVTDTARWLVPKELASYTDGQVEAACTVTCETYNGTALVGKTTDQLTLRVPDATVPVLSAEVVDMGDIVTITLPKEAEAFVHSLEYQVREIDEQSYHIGDERDGDFTGNCEWTFPYEIAKMIPENQYADVTVVCRTWIGGDKLVGTDEVTIRVRVPNNEITKPNLDVQLDLGGGPFPGLAVVSKDLTVTKTVSSEYSEINFFGYSFGANEDGLMIGTKVYTKTYSTAGKQVIVESVTDKRGYTAEVRIPVTVIDYAKPRIVPHTGENNIVCVRCDAAGNVTPSGTSLLIRMGRKYSKVVADEVQNNFCKLSYRWKTSSEDAFSDPVVLLAENAETDEVAVVLHAGLLLQSAVYHIQLVAEDTAGNTEVVTMTVGTSFTTAHSPVGGHGFTLGGYHDPSNVDAFVCLFDAQGKLVGLGRLPEMPSQDANECTDCGCYAVAGASGAHTNMPGNLPGTLRVWSADGCGDAGDAEDILYRIQEFIPRSGLVSYRRALQKRVDAETWTFGPWARSQWEEI